MQSLSRFQEQFYALTSNDIGIDLGTANTLVYLRNKGIVINEPSVVAVNEKTGQIVDVGAGAKEMVGRTPAHVRAVRPLVGGVISDFEITEEMIGYLLSKAQRAVSRKVIGPRVIIGVPSNITNVEQRAVRDAARNAGARYVHVVEEPLAAAIGMRLSIDRPRGTMLIDIGGGTSDIALISMGGLVTSRNLKIAGDTFNQDIIRYVRDEFKILIGEKTAEQVKITTGSITSDNPIETAVRGRDLVSGLPREVVITDTDVREAIAHSVDTLVETIRQVLESAPPEIVSDVMEEGVHLVGGGSLLSGLDEFLEEWLELKVHVADDPLTAVARGTGVMMEDITQYEDTFIQDDEILPVGYTAEQ